MYISNKQPYYNHLENRKPQKSLSFCSNPNSHILEFTPNDFFINIKGYGRDTEWARKVRQLADSATRKIKKANDSDEVLVQIADGIKDANQSCFELKKKVHSGILRTNRKGYGKAGGWMGEDIYTMICDRYSGYKSKFKPLVKKPLTSPFYDVDTAKIEQYNKSQLRIAHPSDDKINNALDRVGGKFFNLRKNFISKPENVTQDTLPEINSDIAEIRWILAHSMPWERGSDAISNIFMRALYKSMGIKTYPIKKDISLDLEAFCTPLDKYKANFGSYFEKEPHIV